MRFPLARTHRLLACLLLALGFAGSAQAQGLVALYEMARAFDATYLAARAQADAAEYRAAQTNALGLPTLNANLRGVSAQVDLPRGLSGDNNALQSGLNGRMPLFNKANQATMEQAQRTLIASKAELEAAEQDLIIRLSQAYFDVLAAKDDVALAKTNKTYILEQLASARRNFEVGTATITDSREAEAQYDLIQAEEISVENDVRVKRLALELIVGRPANELKPLARPVVLPPVTPGEPEPWVQIAYDNSPTVQQARLALEIAKLGVNKAYAGHKPTLDLNASYGNNRYPGGTSSSGFYTRTTSGTVASTVVDASGPTWSILREGAITADQLA